jgi:hypothetical protein
LLTGLGSLSLVQHLRRALPSFFGMDALAANEVNISIGIWLEHSGAVLRS